MKVIVEIKHNRNVDIIYYRAGLLRRSSFSSINEVGVDEVKNREVIVIVPDSLIITKALSIPVDLKNILAIKSYLIKSLPVRLDEVYNNYHIFGNRLYFIGIKKDFLNDYINILRRLGAKVKSVIPKSFLFKVVYNFNQPNIFGFNFDDDYICIFSFEGNGYFFFVVLPYGNNSFVNSNDEIQITKFINEIYRVVSSFQNQTKISIEEFWMFTNRFYRDLPVLSYLSKNFHHLNFVTMDDEKYMDVYSKLISSDKPLSIDLSIDKIQQELNKENLVYQFDRFLNFVVLGLIVILIFYFLVNSDRIKRQEMILQALINNYNSQRSIFINSNQSQNTQLKNDFGFAKIFGVFNREIVDRQIYIENFYLKEKDSYFNIITKRYSDLYFMSNKFKDEGFNFVIEGNSKFNVFNYEFNKANVKISHD